MLCIMYFEHSDLTKSASIQNRKKLLQKTNKEKLLDFGKCAYESAFVRPVDAVYRD